MTTRAPLGAHLGAELRVLAATPGLLDERQMVTRCLRCEGIP